MNIADARAAQRKSARTEQTYEKVAGDVVHMLQHHVGPRVVREDFKGAATAMRIIAQIAESYADTLDPCSSPRRVVSYTE